MTCPTASVLLVPGAKQRMQAALDRYPARYDEALDEVHERLSRAGHATKLDLAALIGWKHVRNAPWMRQVLDLPAETITTTTTAAFASGKTDEQRISALRPIPGFGHGGAFTSVLLTAWRPDAFGVFDRIASKRGWSKVVSPSCDCPRSDLPTYFNHLRQMASELGVSWTPRKVDMALLNQQA
jgi:hypothetical protein